MNQSTEATVKQQPYTNVSLLSKVTHGWLSVLLRKAYKKGKLDTSDLYDIPDYLQSDLITDELESNWSHELRHSPENPNLVRATLKTIGKKIFFLGLFKLVYILLTFVQPLLFTYFMVFFEPCSSETLWKAVLYAISISLITIVTTCMAYTHIYWTDLIGIQIHTAYMGLIYRKILRLSSYSMNSISSGEITNLIANDARSTVLAMHVFDYIWVAPVAVIVSIYLFWYYIRYISIIIIGFTLVNICFQPIYGYIFVYLRTRVVEITDERVKVMSEVLKSMRTIKMYCWESAFVRSISELRRKEIFRYSIFTAWDVIQLFLSANYVSISFLLMYSMFWYFNMPFNSYLFAFTGSLIGYVRFYAILMFSYSIQYISRYLSSRKRIEKFLLLDESKQDERLIANEPNESVTDTDHSLVCDLKSARWDRGEIFCLKDISFRAKPGDLICIIGPVGCGKSSLLQTLSGEITFFDGQLKLPGKLCYVPQEPWIFSSTLQNNITFGKTYDYHLFQRVLRATALDADLEQWSDGSNTQLGDQGVILSGGQKARVNLARALYRDADIYLLDDPLSAVDTKISRHLFEKAIKNYLREKICILVTHQIQYLSDASQVIVLDQGTIVHKGTYDELLQSMPSFIHLLENIKQHEEQKFETIQSQPSTISSKYPEANVDDEQSMLPVPNEEHINGNVDWKVYASYMRAGAGSLIVFALVLSLFIIYQMIVKFTGRWLAAWSDEENIRQQSHTNCSSTSDIFHRIRFMNPVDWNRHRNHRYYVYASTICIAVCLAFSITFICKLLCLNAGRVLHNRMLKRIIRSPMLFFDRNTIGRILNRFTSDMSIMDEELVSDFTDLVECASEVIGIIGLVCFINPWSFLPVIIGAIFVVVIRSKYAPCTRELKRLESASHAPIYSHLHSTIHVDQSSRPTFLLLTVNNWSGIRFDLLSSMFLFTITMLAVVERTLKKTAFSTGDIAVILSNTINLMSLFQWTVRQSVQVESEFTSVERIISYCSLRQEPTTAALSNTRIPVNWPVNGQIIFKNVSMAYSDDNETDPILKDLSFVINSCEKVGIVGRTGAGKSSLIQCLFRLGYIVDGQILIDGINISDIETNDLRSRLSVIPQDPVLFTGTVRSNLDPFQHHSDADLWNAVEQVQLKDTVTNTMSNGLDSLITEGGSNLSVGQKQLVCLARAILKRCKILIVDEATANVDNATDLLIQQAIRNHFKQCTVLTVAHRLRTVIDNDRIMVIDNGRLVEFDTSDNLMSNPGSYFSSLVEQTGFVEVQHLRRSSKHLDTT